MLYLYIYLILKTDNTAWSAWVSQNLPWVGWRDETISQIEAAGVREGGRELCNPYYTSHKAGELFKKLFVVLFLDVSFGDGMRTATSILWQIMWFQLRGWRLKIGELWFLFSKSKRVRDLDRNRRTWEKKQCLFYANTNVTVRPVQWVCPKVSHFYIKFPLTSRY